ncbi:hypothetical protein ACN08Z_05095 [Rothia sp. P7181]
MREKIGMVFLILTILVAVTAMQRGSYWWLGLAICSAVTLWGIGTKPSQK